MEWRQEHSVGIPRFDEDHRIVFGLLKEFENSSGEDSDRDRIQGAFDTLWSYVLSHFKREEDLMEAQGYPGVSEHKAHHQALREGLLELRARYDNDDPNVLSELAPFIDAWLRIHILEQDMAYKAHFEEHMSQSERDQVA